MEALPRPVDDETKCLVQVSSSVPELLKRIVVNELRLCSRWRDLQRGKLVHALAIQNGIDSNIYVANTLLDMYAKCTSMLEARRVFERMRQRSIVSWNVLIAGYADNGDGMAALRLFAQLESGGCSLTYVSAVKACAALAPREEARDVGGKLVKVGSLAKGLAVHRRAGAMGCDADIRVANTLISMYAKCGSLVDAKKTFDTMQVTDVVSWNALILGYVDNGEGLWALELFCQLLAIGAHTNSLTLVAALKACGLVAAKDAQVALQKGLAIHLEAVRAGCPSDMYVGNALVDMFAKCRAFSCAHRIFNSMPERDVVSWNTLILGCAESGEASPALELFCGIELDDRVSPNSLSVVGALKSCASLSGSEEEKLFFGAAVHRRAVDCGCDSDLRVACSLVAMYARCRRMAQAQKVFNAMSQHDVVLWTALIAGYADNGEAELALKLYSRMKDSGCRPNAFTLAAVVKACRALDAIQTGEELQREIWQLGLLGDPGVATSLIDLYAKCCSNMNEARKVFDSLGPKSKNLLTWTALLDGYSRHGDAEQAFQVFQAMQEQLVEPNEVTFLCLLNACNHAGLVDRGLHCFHDMASKYGINPNVEHYACVVDMLGRANRLPDALQLLDSMPFAPDAVTWTALLAAAHKWKNVELASLAFQSLLHLEDDAAASYELMANTL